MADDVPRRRTPAVVDGKITRLSVSALEGFEPELSSFACNRKWWFKEIAGVPEPTDANQQKGIDGHARIENFLKTGQMCLSPMELVGLVHIDEMRGAPVVEDWLDRDVLTLEGIPFVGKIDACDPATGKLRDWKFTSNIARYAKTKGQLEKSVQANGYAEYLFRKYAHLTHIDTAFVYFQTRGKASEKVSCQLERGKVAEHWTTFSPLVRKMTDVAREADVSKVEPNLFACNIGKGCPYRDRCPTAQQEPNIMGLLDQFKLPPLAESKETSNIVAAVEALRDAGAMPVHAPAPAPAAPVEAAKRPGFQIVDACGHCHAALTPENSSRGKHIGCEKAPKPETTTPAPAPAPVVEPKPEPAPAPVVETPAPAADLAAMNAQIEAPRRRGRPPKQPTAGEVPPITLAYTPRLTKITVRHGVTLNMGNYQSAKIDVELELSGQDLTDADRAKLGEQAKLAVAAEATRYPPGGGK